jgi:hypothetical protein
MSMLFSLLLLFSCDVTPITLQNETVCKQVYASEADSILRRHAFLRLLKYSRNRDAILKQGLADRDVAIQGKALYEYFRIHGNTSIPVLSRMAADPDCHPGEILTECIAELQDQKSKKRLFAEILRHTRNPRLIRKVNAANFYFRRVNVRLCDRKDWDFEIVKLRSIPIPGEAMRFATDLNAVGHAQNFFGLGFQDAAWEKMNIGSWSKQGYSGYKGYAWYRIRFKMPSKIDCNAVELAFGAVDEAAWVWLNGSYIGSRDEGGIAWDQPFALDVTREIKWGTENLLAVRVRGNEGGIIKAICVDILK